MTPLTPLNTALLLLGLTFSALHGTQVVTDALDHLPSMIWGALLCLTPAYALIAHAYLTPNTATDFLLTYFATFAFLYATIILELTFAVAISEKTVDELITEIKQSRNNDAH